MSLSLQTSADRAVSVDAQHPPVELLSCSWPRPVRSAEWQWLSEPEWDAPLMPSPPRPYLEVVDGELCWTIDWRDFFRSGLKLSDAYAGGDMRGFHVVFRVRVHRGGTMRFWDDDGSIIRRNGRVVHADRSAHVRRRAHLDVQRGDVLDIAQWQAGWDWLFSVQVCDAETSPGLAPRDVLQPYRDAVAHRLASPDGPPLKLFTHGSPPLRAILAAYSLVLNGYAPVGVHLFGDHQWSPATRDLLAWALPTARVHATDAVLAHLRQLGGVALTELARRHWFVMKTCIGVLCPPREACMLDDDVVILESLAEALAEFERHDLVFAPDQDLSAGFRATWRASSLVARAPRSLPTARFNAGLYWIRPVEADLTAIARQMLGARPDPRAPFFWEQGFIALLYARYRTLELPSQRYFFPLFDGLPGGVLGYDYAANPCSFASVHFGGLRNKPSDGGALEILFAAARRAQGVRPT